MKADRSKGVDLYAVTACSNGTIPTGHGVVLCVVSAISRYTIKMKPKQDSAKTQEQPDDIKKLSRHVTNQLVVMYLFVAVVVVSSWGLGTMSFSFQWVFLLLALLFMIWKVRLSALIRKKLHIEESNIHRKRALRQSETAEWLNFAVNRW